MFSLRSMKFLCLVVAALLLAALPAAAAPASAPEDRGDLVVTARGWMGELLDSVLAAFGLTGDTEDPALTDTTTPDPPPTTTATEPPPDDEGGNWDPNGG